MPTNPTHIEHTTTTTHRTAPNPPQRLASPPTLLSLSITYAANSIITGDLSSLEGLPLSICTRILESIVGQQALTTRIAQLFIRTAPPEIAVALESLDLAAGVAAPKWSVPKRYSP